MKKLLVGFTLLIAISSFADDQCTYAVKAKDVVLTSEMKGLTDSFLDFEVVVSIAINSSKMSKTIAIAEDLTIGEKSGFGFSQAFSIQSTYSSIDIIVSEYDGHLYGIQDLIFMKTLPFIKLNKLSYTSNDSEHGSLSEYSELAELVFTDSRAIVSLEVYRECEE